MKFPRIHWLILASLLAAAPACNWRETADGVARATVPPEDQSGTGLQPGALAHDLEHTVHYLASPELEGRGVGTEGLNLAAQYIAYVFTHLQLQPLPGHDDHFQAFAMTTAARVDAASNLIAGDRTFALNNDFAPVTQSAVGPFSGGAVFAGYGIASEAYGYDDYAEIDAEGKVVIAMRFEPHDEEGNSRFAPGDGGDWSAEATVLSKARTAAERGATALLLVNPPHHHDEPGLLTFSARPGAERAPIPVVHVAQDLIDELIAQGGGGPLAALQAMIDQTGQPHSLALADLHVSGEVVIQETTHDVSNVVAWLPGEGRADEYIVIGAHYDHLGRGERGGMGRRRGQVHPGADDNASGVAVMLELAQHFVQNEPPQRSLIFVAFTAEESGLVGSRHFVQNPPVPLERITAMLNFDMVGRVRANSLLVGGTGTAGAFDEILSRAGRDSPLTLRTISRGGMGPSDHMTFALERIPVLFFFSGFHGDYHRPSDTPDKINFPALRQVAELAVDVVGELALAPRLQYVDAYDGQSMISPVGAGGGRVRLGIIPDYAPNEPITGVRVGGTVPGAPAAEAGLQVGDVIVSFDGREIEAVHDLTEIMADAEPGQQVRLVIERDGELMEIEVTPAERR